MATPDDKVRILRTVLPLAPPFKTAPIILIT